MNTPPFRLTPVPSGHTGSNPLYPLRDRCCEPPAAPRLPRPGRARFAELDPDFYCSVIGTCLGTAELRRIVARFTNLDGTLATDLQLHHAAVELATQGGEGAKALHKAMDRRYAQAIKRFGAAKDVNALHQLWTEALKTGAVPPAYWALMTHPASTQELRLLAFGDVHMLSHLVGATNHADIRRLVALEEENTTLKGKINRQQGRLQTIVTERNAIADELNNRIDELNAQLKGRPDRAAEDLQAELAQLRSTLDERDQTIAMHANRCTAADDRLKAEQAHVQTLRQRLNEALDVIEMLKSEAQAMEHAMLHSMAASADTRPTLEHLQGKRIVYVGGRPGTNTAIARLVESAGGWLTTHDGGVENRKSMLVALIPGADMVVFPVDCIDHDSMNTLKRVCDRHMVAYHPLRTASVASFVELMTRDAHKPSQLCGSRTASAVCLRHG